MIVVRANLYQSNPERARVLRPKWIAGTVGALLLALLLVSDYGESQIVSGLRKQAIAARSLASELTQSVERERVIDAQLRATLAKRDAVLRMAVQRRNWAPILAQALGSVPPTAELSTLHIKAEIPEVPEVRVAGRGAGAKPRLEADKCLLQLTHAFAAAGLPMTGRFESLDDAPARASVPAPASTVANFVLHFTTTEKANAN